MPTFGPIKRKDLVRHLKMLGFEGPYSGGKHQYLIRGELRLTIPNPHQGEISKALLSRILRQAEITRQEWEALE
jgi:predicted RNA binding protein YcfA (HicA-like mRNA interferase family)